MIQQSCCATEDQTDFNKQAKRMGQKEWEMRSHEMRHMSKNKHYRNRKTGISYFLINNSADIIE